MHTQKGKQTIRKDEYEEIRKMSFNTLLRIFCFVKLLVVSLKQTPTETHPITFHFQLNRNLSIHLILIINMGESIYRLLHQCEDGFRQTAIAIAKFIDRWQSE